MYLIRHSGRQARRLSRKQAFHWKFVLTHRCRTLVSVVVSETTTDTQDVSTFFIDFEGKMFIIRNIYSRSLTPSHTARDAFMN